MNINYKALSVANEKESVEKAQYVVLNEGS